MEDRLLNGTGLHVSRLCFGAMTFGAQTDEKTALNMLDYAFDKGINFVDTANAYSAGNSERIVGKWIKDKREDIILATKVGYPVVQLQSDKQVPMSRKYILSCVEDSLKRLDTDYIDIYYMHSPLFDCPVEEAMFTFSELVRAGKIRYVGVSNQAAWQICEEKMLCEAKGYVAPVITQNGYNMIARSVEPELVPFTQKHKVAFVNYNPLAGGLLTGKHNAGAPIPGTRFDNNKMYLDRYWNQRNFDAIEKLKQIAAQAGMGMAEMAMRWCVTRDCINAIIIGVSKMEQLEMNIEAVNKGPLDDALMAACDDVWQELAGKFYQYNRQ